MIQCNRPGCSGTTLKTGFCDHCGLKPLPEAIATEVLGTEQPRVIEPPEPASRILADPRVPESNRNCENRDCGAPVGRSIDGRPGPTEGYCHRCGTPFSFSPRLEQGEVVENRYVVVGCIARGGLGWIHLAEDRKLGGTQVVLKGLINANDTAAAKLAVNESEVLTALDHPNIVRICDVVTHPDPLAADGESRYIVMDYVDGRSLREVKNNARVNHGLPVEQVLSYGKEILTALGYLHDQGLLYCDMKPDNVIHGERRIKLIDLGAVRRIGDRTSPIVGTERYQVSKREIDEHGLTVRSDIHTVGVTLKELFGASDGWSVTPETRNIEFGVESFRRVLARATAGFGSRFASAAEMSAQLDGVLNEILSLRDSQPRPTASTMFTETAVLLDAGLGQPPPLEAWTGGDFVPETVPVLADGRPSAFEVALGLPTPQVGADDAEAAFLNTVRAPDPVLLLEKLAKLAPGSVEAEYRRFRAHLELNELGNAGRCLSRAGDLLGLSATHDWRASWYRGLLALAHNKVSDAEARFDQIYRDLPGEEAPKLALGFCAEHLGRSERAERYYEAVWTRDRTQVSAAFGLARVSLSRGDGASAVEVLDQVPEVSLHYHAAVIGTVRILSGRLVTDALPTAEGLDAAVGRLTALRLDGESTERLTTTVRETALACVLGDPVKEKGLRDRLEQSYRLLARQARTAEDHGVLIDLANRVRARTRF